MNVNDFWCSIGLFIGRDGARKRDCHHHRVSTNRERFLLEFPLPASHSRAAHTEKKRHTDLYIGEMIPNAQTGTC
jgi:hypothetical protein